MLNITGQKIYLGLYFDSNLFAKQIFQFNENLLNYGINRKLFIPINRLHISLIQIELEFSILKNSTFKKIKKILKQCVSKYNCVQVIPDKIIYGEESKSIKVMLDSKSQKFIRSLRDEIILKVKSTTDIYFNDSRSFVPHVSILSSLNENSLNDSQINMIKNEVNYFNSNFILHKIDIRKISMLLPLCPKRRNEIERKIYDKTTELSVDL